MIGIVAQSAHQNGKIKSAISPSAVNVIQNTFRCMPQSNAASRRIFAASYRRYQSSNASFPRLWTFASISATLPRNMPTTSPSGFRVETRELDECFVVECHGRLTGENAPLLRDEVRAIIPRHKSIIIDLQAVPMLDSSGLGAIAGLYVSARTRGCSLGLANANPQIHNLFRVTNLISLFDVVGRYGRL